MSGQNKVVWSEGLFIKPQHFQQEARYFRNLLNLRMQSTGSFLYGVNSLEFNHEHLAFGKISLLRASGIMPDGSVFEIPLQSASPEPLMIDDPSLVGQTIYLATPLSSLGTTEIQLPDNIGQSRYLTEQQEVKDLHSKEGNSTSLQTAKLNTCLLLDRDNRNAYTSIAIAKIQDIKADKSIALYNNFYPTSLSVSAIPSLQRFLEDTTDLIRARAHHLAEQINSPNQSGVAEVNDFMLLQTLNRIYPQFRHLSRLKQLHPERLYHFFSGVSGELSTFNEKNRLVEDYPAYQHDDCKPSFEPLIKNIRQGLGTMMQTRAVNIPITKEQYGNWVAPVNDSSLIDSADFILAVKAQVSTDKLLTDFPQQAKISSLEKISQLINLQLPGIPIKSLPVTPKQLPYHAGFSYFLLDKNHPIFKKVMPNSAGFGFHITSNLPELELQFWAIRDSI